MKEAFSKFEVVRYLNFFATRQALLHQLCITPNV